MPTYEHQCEKCGHIWEDLFSSYKSPVPEECPECKEVGCIKRLVSWCSGTVELTGREFSDKLRSDTQKLKQEARSNENLRANLIGEDKYNKQCSRK